MLVEGCRMWYENWKWMFFEERRSERNEGHEGFLFTDVLRGKFDLRMSVPVGCVIYFCTSYHMRSGMRVLCILYDYGVRT